MVYSEDGGFWDRDGALVSEGFRELGVDSKFVALGEPDVRKDRPLILCTLPQMMDPGWWRQWGLEGVLLYAWALRRYEPIARAIKTAGVKLILVLDSSGYVHPRVGLQGYFQENYYVDRDGAKRFPAGRALLKTLAAFFPPRHTGILQHLAHGDFLVLPSPLGQQRYSRFLQAVGRPDLAQRVRFVPYAVTPDMNYHPTVQKHALMIAVGRWQSFQKGAPILARVLARVLCARPEYSCRIIGGGGERMRELIKPLDEACRSRINILGRVPHAQLARHYKESRVLLCTSYFESFHIAAGEALCCGASVVGDARISSMPYLCAADSGTLSRDLSINYFAAAVLAEIDAWRGGGRDPVKIAATWCARLHPEHVAAAFLKLA